jgi:AcrR family transcriptional regulator
MLHIMKEKKPYRSSLREEQTKQTRERILEGLIKVMANGIAELSIPAVAREAGVSVPTVYRYFRTKKELVEALGGYLMEKKMGINTSTVQLPRSPEELAAAVRGIFLMVERQDETVLAASASELSYEMRKEGLPQRLRMIEQALAPVAGQFNEADRIRLRNVVLILSSSAMVRAFKNYLDLSGAEAADNVAWAILTLTKAVSEDKKAQQE